VDVVSWLGTAWAAVITLTLTRRFWEALYATLWESGAIVKDMQLWEHTDIVTDMVLTFLWSLLVSATLVKWAYEGYVWMWGCLS
jgi:hypothetical protein